MEARNTLPGVSPDVLHQERACFYGALLTALAYGALVMLYMQLAQVLLARPKRGTDFWAIIVYSGFLFPLATVALGAVLRLTEWSYIDNRLYEGGPTAFFRAHNSNYVNVILQISCTLFPWFADVLMVARLLVIWNNKRWTVVCPILLYLAKMAISIPLLLALIRPRTSKWSSQGEPYGLAYHALTAAFNLYVTCMICLRLSLMRSRLEAIMGKLHASFYTSMITMFVESGGLFTLWTTAYLIIRSRGNFVQDVFLTPYVLAIGITRILIVLRMAQDRAWSKELVAATEGGVLDWQVSSTLSVPLHDIPSGSAMANLNNSSKPLPRKFQEV